MSQATTQRPKVTKKRYKLLRSVHIQAEQTDEKCTACFEGKVNGISCSRCRGTGLVWESRHYTAGVPGQDIVESADNLQLRHGFEKFQALDVAQAGMSGDALLAEIEALRAKVAELEADKEVDETDLSAMTKTQLLAFAKKFDPPIDLSEAATKSEMVNILQSEMDSM